MAFEETRLSGQALWVTGKLQFTVLYRSDDEHSKLETLEGAIPFQEKLVMEGAEDMDPVNISGELEDLSVGLINSRKLSIRAVVHIKGIVEERTEELIADHLEDDGPLELKISEKEFTSVAAAEKDVVRFHSEVALSNAKPNIERLLWREVQLRNVESSITAGKIRMQGELYFSVVYQGEGGTQPQWMETLLPFSREIECADVKEDKANVLWLNIRPESVEVEPRNDIDGESRIFGVDLAFSVEYKIWEEQKLPVLMDAYALNKTLKVQRTPCQARCFLMKNEAKLRVGDTVTLDSNQEKILQICSCTGKISIDRITPEEEGIRFEGVVTAELLYLTFEDNFPIAYTQCTLPFEQLVEINGIQKDTWYDYMTSLDLLQVNLLDSSEFEIKASIRITVLAFEENCFDKIDHVDEEPFSMEALDLQPGLVGYVVQEGEELWDIAKQYHTTMEELSATNNLGTANVRPGTKLVIVKQVAI
jgi:hypothetical protein